MRPEILKPVDYALHKQIDADVFIILTSSNDFTNRYSENLLNKYRQQMKRPYAQLVVCALGSHDFTFADPRDPGMFDVCGFDDCLPHYLMKITNALTTTAECIEEEPLSLTSKSSSHKYIKL